MAIRNAGFGTLLRMKKKIDHINKRVVFGIVCFLIPGFTAIIIFGLRILIETIFDNCQVGWAVATILGGLISFVAPLLYFIHLKNNSPSKNNFWIFGLIEYLGIQSFAVVFFVTADSSCHGHTAQNGLEYIFTAWLSIPLILLFDYLLIKSTYTNRNKTTAVR